MKRNYRLYANENSVGFWPDDPSEKIPTTDILFKRGTIPHDAGVRVFEVLARDPMRAACYYCSPIRQQSAILIRHEVTASPPEGVERWTDKQSEEVTEWCGDLEHKLSREADAWNLYGRSTFDKWPYVETTVEVDDDDLDGLDEDEIEKKFESQLQEDESCSPTWVVLAPEDRYRVGPDPDYDDDNEGEE